ncbi:hypothetical protein OH77DRAFT_664373 [Trametes cingulata]|nr:hypothetical protein OH77DRAFT_664373 [Trametes cingulata]
MTDDLSLTCGDGRGSRPGKVAVAQGLGRSRGFQKHVAVAVRTDEGGRLGQEGASSQVAHSYQLRNFFIEIEESGHDLGHPDANYPSAGGTRAIGFPHQLIGRSLGFWPEIGRRSLTAEGSDRQDTSEAVFSGRAHGYLKPNASSIAGHPRGKPWSHCNPRLTSPGKPPCLGRYASGDCDRYIATRCHGTDVINVSQTLDVFLRASRESKAVLRLPAWRED